MPSRIVVALLALSCGALTPAFTNAQEKTSLATAAAVTFAPARAGVEKGFFKAEGLDLEIKLVPGGNDAIQALAGGAIDFGESSHAQFLSASAKAIPIVAIGLHSYGFLGKLVASNKNANLKELAEFKGKRIGVQVGTGVYTVLMMALERQGLKDSDFVISNVRVNDMPAAMQSDTFDAVLAWEPQASRIVQSGRGKEVMSARAFEQLADVTYPFLILTTEKTVRERPATVQKYLNAFARAQRFMLREQKEAVAIYRKHLPQQVANQMSEDELHFQLYHASLFDRLVPNDRDLADLRRTSEFMVKQKTLQSMPDLDKSVNLTFARKAATALGN